MNIEKDIIRKIEERGLGTILWIDKLLGGCINDTFKIKTETGVYVIQKLHQICSKDSFPDYVHMYTHLQDQLVQKHHLKIPHLVSTWMDSDGFWKVTEYIPHFKEIKLNNKTSESAVKYLIMTHQALNTCCIQPRFSIPGFHDSTAIFSELTRRAKGTSTLIIQELADLICGKGQSFALLPRKKQLIHGDPKFNNFLFNENEEVVAFIDWDTLMCGDVLIDVGDIIRSFCKSEDNIFDTERFRVMAEIYRTYSRDSYYSDETLLRATKLISLELAARFLIDWFEESYFQCRPGFANRKESNLASAQKYVSYFETMP